MFRYCVLCFLAVQFFPFSASYADDLNWQAAAFDFRVPEGTYIEETPGLALSPDEKRIYVFNRGQRQLLVFGRNGRFVREIGNGLFTVPHGLRVDADGNIWTADTGTHLVLKFSPEGKVLMVLGKKGTAAPGWFDRDYNQVFLNKPSDIAFDEDRNIYVADGGNFRIVKYSPEGIVLKVFGEKGSGPGQFNFPHSVVVDGKGQLLVADRENKRVQLFSPDGSYLGEWKNVGYPYNLAKGKEEVIWITDARAEKVIRMRNGERDGDFGLPGKTIGHYGFLHGVVPFGENLLVSDILNWKVEILRPGKSQNSQAE